MYRLHQNVEKIETAEGKRWEDVCMKLPIVYIDLEADKSRDKRDASASASKKRNPSKENDESWGSFFDDFDNFAPKEEEGFENQATYGRFCF